MSTRLRVVLALFCALAAVTLTIGLVAAVGSPMWQANGVALVVADKDQQAPQIVSDGSGGAIVTWYDNRNFAKDIYARRVDQDGNALWGTDGVIVCGASSGQWSPQIASDGSGGAIVTWYDQRDFVTTDSDIYARRVDGNGNALWTLNGVSLCVALNGQVDPQIASDGAGGAIVTWIDKRDDVTTSQDIYVRRVDGNGNALWDTDGVSLCVATSAQEYPQIVPDGSGGAIVTWQDQRYSGTTKADIYARRVDSNGNALWDTDGVSLCVATNAQEYPQIASDGSGGAIVTWTDQRTDGGDIYAQRVDGDGNPLWVADGVSLCVDSSIQHDQQIVSDGAGGAIVTWQDYRYSQWDIYAQRVDTNGNALWQADGAPLCTFSWHQQDPQIVSDGSGGAIVTWEDYRYSQWDIYAQRVDSYGNILWVTDGVSLCVASNNQENPRIAPDGYWGAIVTWEDLRDSDTNDRDIYAQRVGGVAKVDLPLVAKNYE